MSIKISIYTCNYISRPGDNWYEKDGYKVRLSVQETYRRRCSTYSAQSTIVSKLTLNKPRRLTVPSWANRGRIVESRVVLKVQSCATILHCCTAARYCIPQSEGRDRCSLHFIQYTVLSVDSADCKCQIL